MRSLFLAALFLFCEAIRAQSIIPQGSSWKFFKGTAEPSAAVGAWRTNGFSDATWLTGNSPIYYGETFASGTQITDMRNTYTTLYLRKGFNVADPTAMDRLVLRVLIDDGYILWINGKEAVRYNVTVGEKTHTNLATATIEQTWTTNTVVASDYLVAGANTLAVQVFNSVITSSDIVFELQMDSTGDKIPPTIANVSPAPGQVQQLTSITVNFSEPVQGVNALDFLVNATAATSVSGSGASYTFTFAQPPYGQVNISWEPGHQIGDLASPPNPFDSTAPSAQWSYQLRDTTAPTVLTLNPPNGSTVAALSQIDARFSETVAGVNASDLLINGAPAMNVVANGTLYSFQFPARPPGALSVTWAASHGITDVAVPPNAFVPQPYSYTVDPNYVPPTAIISEFLAAEQAATALKDEDGELEDWIEIYNATASPVNLENWSLTDDPEDPDLWLFPNVTLAAGARMVVFASGKDRRPTTGNLHTNFKLNNAGEFIGLFNTESPRRGMTAFHYPEQRNDYSYGLDSAGQWQYFATPTPGQPNGSTTIVGLIPKLKPSVKRGTFETAFTLAITNEVPDVTIRYTLDGSEPIASTPNIYSGPMTISKTTVLRAAAFKANYLPSETLTESYIFLDQVIAQSNNPAGGFPVGATVWSGYPSDYEMDPEITTAPEYKNLIKPALQALPIISLTISPYDMWDSVNGLYTHPTSRGPSWERPCSMEFFAQDGKGFQIDAGLQIQGNAAREPIKNPKHPMRVVFKGDYGPTKLNFQMFPDSPLQSFDTLVLRADFNNGWLHWDTAQRARGQRIRDSFMKDSMRAMGDLASHNRYTHLFINGVYWGIYDPSERPDAAFAASYLGGNKSDWDVVNEGAAVDGTMTAYNQMLAIANPADIAQYNSMKTYLDMPQFIDYMLLHFYVGHEDWGANKNWYTMRPKDGSAGFKYVPWDGENILGAPSFDRVSNADTPSGLHTKLLASPEYKVAFADRVQKHFFNNGALTPAAVQARFAKRSKEIETAIIAESTRWGDYRRDVHQYSTSPYELYTRNVQWAAEQARLTNTYFPVRTATVLSQLRTAGLYPSLNAPAFSQNGGRINPNFQLTISGASVIYYTTNGIDPRVYGTGAVAPDAKAYSGPITLPKSAIVKARTLNAGTWSALSEATFSTESPRIPLRFTEIMYNPDPPGDAYEYLEMQNFGTLPLDVSGWFITGVDYIFPPQTVLTPGQIVLLGSSQNTTGFKTRYRGVTPFGYFGGQLVNNGERIAIVRPDGRVVTSVPYDDEAGWATQADGLGYSLEVIDPFADAMDPANWGASAALKGTPGVANPTRAAAPVVINELYSTSADTTDFIELRSTTNADMNIGGWNVWRVGVAEKFVFPLDTILPAGSYAMIHCDKRTNDAGFHAAFALDRDGDTIILFDGRGGRVDARTVGPQADGYSSGLSNGKWNLSQPTPGSDNVAVTNFAPASALAINEWLSNPLPGEDDWFEIYNSDPALPADLRGLFMGVTNQMYEITLPTFIAPGGFAKFKANENSRGVDFKLPAEGETISIYNASGAVVQQLNYIAQAEGVSAGRYPDGTPNIIDLPFATPGAENTLSFPIAFTISANVLRLSWPSVTGISYEIQAATELTSAASWQPAGHVTAANSTPSYDIDIVIDNSNRYFRVVRQP